MLALLLLKVHRDVGYGERLNHSLLNKFICSCIVLHQTLCSPSHFYCICFSFQIFFVLRKKNSQVTFLHVYHHSIMPFTWWFGVRFSAGRNLLFLHLISVVQAKVYDLAFTLFDLVCRRHGDISRPAQLHRPRCHVHVLRPDCSGPQIPEVPVVEEVPDDHSAGMLFTFLLNGTFFGPGGDWIIL